MSLCDLCEDQPAQIKCASCKGIGTGEQFCSECCDQLHSAAKTRGHALTDMEGRPRNAAAASGAAVVAAVSTPAKPVPSTSGGTVTVSKIPLCSLCDDVVATVQCTNCKNAAYCADCNTDFHMPAKQAGHTQLRFVTTADSEALPTTASVATPMVPLQRSLSGTPAKPPSPLLRSNSLLRSPMLNAAATPAQPATPGSLPRNSLALIASATPGSASTRPRGMSLAMFARPGSAGLNSPLSPTLSGMGSSTTGGSFSKPFSLVGAASSIKSPPSPGLSSSASSNNLLPGVASIRSLAALDRLPSIDAAVPATSDEAKQCALCELDLATFRCDACDESYCDECNELSHTTAAKMAHTRTKISGAASPTANAPLFPTPPRAAAPSATAVTTIAAPAAKEAVATPTAAPAPAKAPVVVSGSMTTLAAPSPGASPSSPPHSASPSPAGSRRGSLVLKRPPGISTTLGAPNGAAIPSAVKPVAPAPAVAVVAPAAATATAAKPAPAAAPPPAPVAAAPASMCSVCEDEPATVRCPDCKEDLCSGCDKQMHMPAKLAGHVRSAIGEAAPTRTAATAAALLAAAQPVSTPVAPVAVTRPVPTPAPAATAPSVPPAAVVKPAEVVAPVAVSKPATTAPAAAPVVAPAAKPPAAVVAAAKPATPAVVPAAAIVPAASAKPVKVILCDMCDDLPSAFKCDECEMALCADCDLSLHKPVKQSTHQRVPMAAVPAVAPEKPATTVAPPAAAVAAIKPPAAVPAPVAAAKPPVVVSAPAATKPATALPAVVPAAVVLPLKLAAVVPAVAAAPTKPVTPVPATATATAAKPAAPPAPAPAPIVAAPASMCSVCEDEPATVRCPDCKEDLCSGCDKQMHMPAKLAGHVRAPIGQTASKQTAAPAPLPTPSPKVDLVPLKSPVLPSPPIAAAPTTMAAATIAVPPKTVVAPPPTLVLQPSKPSTPTLVLSPRGQPSPKVLADRAAFDKQLGGGAAESRPPSVIPPPVDITSRPPSTSTAPPSQTSTRASSIAHLGGGASTKASSSVVSSSAASSGLESDAAPDPMDNADDFDLEFDMGDMDGSDPFEIETLESLPASRHSPVPTAAVAAAPVSAIASPTTSAAAFEAQSQAQNSDRHSARDEHRSSSSHKRDRDRDRDHGSRRSHGDRSHSRTSSRGESRSGQSRGESHSHHSPQQQPLDDVVLASNSVPLHRHYSVNSGDDGSDRERDRGRDSRGVRREEDDFEDGPTHRFLHVRPPSQQGGSPPGLHRENHTPTPPAFASPRKSSLKSPSSTPRGRTTEEYGRDSRFGDRTSHTPGSRQGFRDEYEPDLYSTAFERSSRTRRDARDRDRISHRHHHHRSRSRFGSSDVGGDRPASAVGEELSETVSALVGSNHQAASLLQQLLSVLHRPDGHDGDVAHPATALMQIAQMATTAALDLDPHQSQLQQQQQQFDDSGFHSPRLMQHRPARLQDPHASSGSLASLHRNSSSRSSILSPRKQQPFAMSMLHRKSAASRSSRLLLREGTPISADQASLNEAWLARKLRERLASSQQHAREGLLVPASAVYAPLTPQPPSHAHSFQAQWEQTRPGSAQAFTARPSTTPSAFAAAFPSAPVAAPPLQAQMFYSPTAAAAAAAVSSHPHAYAWVPVQPVHSASASPFVPSPPQSAPPLGAAATASLLASPAVTTAVFASLMSRSPDGTPLPLPVASSPHQHALAVAAATAAYHAARQATMQQPPPLTYASSPYPPLPSPHPSPLPIQSPLASGGHLTYASPVPGAP